MIRSFFPFSIFLFITIAAISQPHSYQDSIAAFRKDYISSHEVVKGVDKDSFRFFKADKKYKVQARFEKLVDSTGFIMKTSGPKKSKYFRYGKLHFRINKKELQLTIYQSERLMTDTTYKNYLFVPFTDRTSGEASYGGGRYLDFFMDEIKNNYLTVDFNKAYNPYCAYAAGFSCPIPPYENDLPIQLEAGEMNFAKHH